MKQLEHNLPIASEAWCLPYPTQFLVKEKTFSLSSNDFKVRDPNGNVVFTFKGHALSVISDKTTMYQGDGTQGPALLNLRKQFELIPFTDMFKVYSGTGSSGEAIMNITVRGMNNLFFKLKAEVPHLGITLVVRNVGMTRNKEVFIGDDPEPVATIHWNFDLKSIVLDRDSYVIDVAPRMDSAAMCALAVVVDMFLEKGD